MTKKKPILGTVLRLLSVIVVTFLPTPLDNLPLKQGGSVICVVSCVLILLITVYAFLWLVYVMIKRSEWSNYRDPLASMRTIKRDIESKEESIQHLNWEINSLKKVLFDYTKE